MKDFKIQRIFKTKVLMETKVNNFWQIVEFLIANMRTGDRKGVSYRIILNKDLDREEIL